MIRFAKNIKSILLVGMLLFLPLIARDFPEKLCTDYGKEFHVQFLNSACMLDEFGRKVANVYRVALSTEGERVIRIGYLSRMYEEKFLRLQELDGAITFYFDQTDSQLKKRRALFKIKSHRGQKRSRTETPPPLIDLEDSDD